MKQVSRVFACALVFWCFRLYSGYTQTAPEPATVSMQTKTVDVNKDGKPDVTYYGDGKYVTEVQADTNYDGKSDVVVHLKDGKFQSAEADTDYNGTMDKKFSDVKEFNQWLNKNNPAFEEELNRPDWQFNLLQF